jgi:16S rRNA (cytosine1402-N4)-methyltransferase
MVHEVVQYLRCARGGLFVDATLGTGGHTLAILQHSPSPTRIIGIDRDPKSLAVARERLLPYSNQLRLIQGKFGDLKEILFSLGIQEVDGILLDLGFSSFQLETSGRGFSFRGQEPLDMRMNQAEGERARDWLARVDEKILLRTLIEYGEERWAKRIARKIISAREKGPIQTTDQLSELVQRAVPKKRSPQRIHPATRTFQALRIQVNDELTQLKFFLDQFWEILKTGGRVCLISYHSLEDRLIKQGFLKLERGDDSLDTGKFSRSEPPSLFRRVTVKPIVPSPEEIQDNPRARGAKLRVGERVGGSI